MNVVKIQSLGKRLTYLGYGAAVLLGVSLWLLPLEHPAPQIITRETQKYPAKDAAAAAVLPTLTQWEVLQNIDLNRRPQVVAAIPALNLRIAGMESEQDKYFALLQWPDGRTERRTVGDSIGEAKVLAVDENSVTLLYHNQQVRLTRGSGGQP